MVDLNFTQRYDGEIEDTIVFWPQAMLETHAWK